MKSYSENLDEKHVSQDKSRYITFKKSIQKIFSKLNISDLSNKTFLDIGSASGVFLKVIIFIRSANVLTQKNVKTDDNYIF